MFNFGCKSNVSFLDNAHICHVLVRFVVLAPKDLSPREYGNKPNVDLETTNPKTISSICLVGLDTILPRPPALSHKTNVRTSNVVS